MRYFVIYKPYGTLSQFTPEGNKPGLGSLYPFPKNCYPVGRLDSDSEGLLIITDDPLVNKSLLNPTHRHARTYYIQVEGEITEEALQTLREGVTIRTAGQMHETRPAKAEKIATPVLPERNPPIRFRKSIPTSWINLELSEGKNRQARHMTAAVGFPSLRLVRVKIENLEIDGMLPGEVRSIAKRDLFYKLKLTE